MSRVIADGLSKKASRQYAELSGDTPANFTAMPQVGGDPIVESGSNADGEFTKFSDGTLCMASSVIGDSLGGSGRIDGSGTLPSPVINTADARSFGELDSFELSGKVTLMRMPLSGTTTIALRIYSATGSFVAGDETDALINVFTFARWK
jgi:hypothetical protein